MTRLPLTVSLSTIALILACAAGAAAAEELCVCRYCQGAAQLGPEPGATTDARHYAPDRVIDVLNIKINVTPDFETHTIAGETTLTFKPISRPVDEVILDAVDLRVTSVTASQEIKDWVNDGEHLTILFAAPLKLDREAEVVVKYTAEPDKGLYFRTAKDGYPAGDTHLWTQGEPHEARHWFPNFDYPNEKSTSEVICHVPSEMTVLSNGSLVSTDEADGQKTVHWKQDLPHASYLICLAAGKFAELTDQAGDIPLGFYTQPSLAEHAKNSFADTAKIMEFYQQEIGVPYPWAKYYQVTGRDFIAGGMENTTLTVLTERTIYSDETENLRSSRNLDAHEMAHQWFGDYVTCEDWANLWLNEGFATFYTHLYDAHKLGRDEMLYRLYNDATRAILTKDKDTRPIVYRGYKAAWDQFDFRAYPKGAWVLHMLRSQLGKDLYRQAIKNYLEKHAFTSVTTPDLMAELEDVSGRSLDRFFDQWVYHGGFPVLKVSYKWLPKEGLAKVSVKQTQEVNNDVLLFHLPTKLRFAVDGKNIDHAITVDQKEQDFYVPLPGKPSIVRFDPELTVLAKVEFDKPQEMLEEQLKNEQDVVGRLLAVAALKKKKDAKSLEALKTALNSDPFYGVRLAAADALSDRESDEAYEALAASLNQEDARVRKEVIESIGKFYRAEALEQLSKVVSEEKNPDIAASAVRSLSAYTDPAALDAIRGAMGKESFQNVLAEAAIAAAARTADPTLTPAVMRTLSARRQDFTDRGMAESLQALGKLAKDTEHAPAARKVIVGYLNDPSSKVQTGAVEALGELGDRRSIAALRTYSSREDRLGRAAKQAIEKIEKDAPSAPKEVSELRKLVRELGEQQEKMADQLKELKGKNDADAATGDDEKKEPEK
ncbi:Aminopeptidase N [Posidoniimonas polymericola]|uniref:Aminopeptidase N n=1 Tax=Posidoniimonas polymericola TaxID=2528002 RepID=A0A5C5YHT6_9BACT|nr:M1 family aminopeptidase [Posidoniimonas polymericola]TWT74561.1 Aminopeptidase N [Posidoniimonas polymericola]